MLFKIILLMVLFGMSPVAHSAEVTIHKNEVSGLLTWTANDVGFRVEFIQLLQDFRFPFKLHAHKTLGHNLCATVHTC